MRRYPQGSPLRNRFDNTRQVASALLYDCSLITGASSGLGEEFSCQLAPHCRRLVLVARRENKLELLRKRLLAENEGLEVAIYGVDLTCPDAREELLGEVANSDWSPSLLVNNAGMGDYGEFTTGNWEKLEQMLSLNITAVTHLAHGFLPGMIRSGHGAILNVSSLASLLPIPDFAVYAASKAYVTSFSEALRLELQAHDIPVVAVCPGPVHTGFGGIAGREGSPEETPMREWFFVSKEEVVLEALLAVQREQPRSYPGLQISLLAAVLAFMPPSVLRYFMRNRPRATPEEKG